MEKVRLGTIEAHSHLDEKLEREGERASEVSGLTLVTQALVEVDN